MMVFLHLGQRPRMVGRLLPVAIFGVWNGICRILAESSHSNSLLTEFFDSGVERTEQISTITDSTFSHGGSDSFRLGDWFSRPVKIATYNWSEGTALDQTFDPWYLYFSNPEIYDKIKGFSRLQATLHVKLTINASPYQYSMGIMSYKPLTSLTNDCFSGGQVDAIFTTGDPSYSVATSRPHTFFYPQFSRGCEMTLPFVYYKNWINLDTNLTEIQNMGRVRLQSVVNLKTTSTPATQPIVVSIFAWCDYHRESAPSYSLQAGDEYAERPVSITASALSRAAQAMTVVPPLRPYAMATSMVMEAIGNIARYFGFSNPPVIKDVHAFRSNFMSQYASPEISVQHDKLALDPKNEVCIDPRTVGLTGRDEMDISTVCNRDVILDTATWNATDTVTTPLLIVHVGPQFSFEVTSVGTTTGKNFVKVQMTPSAHIGCLFDMWTGPITYRFTSVASQFHRGRLLVSYDPDGFKDTYTSSAYTGPRTISKVWDIEKNSDFEFVVPYMAPTAYLKTGGLLNQTTDRGRMLYSRPVLPGTFYYEDSLYNGSIIISVLNGLTSNDPSASITLVTRYNCGDIEFAVPKDLDIPISAYILQSGEDHALAAEPDDVVTATVPHEVHPGQLIYTGELVKSLRQLLHRTNYVYSRPIYTIYQTPKTVYSDTVPNLSGGTSYSYGIWDSSLVMPHIPLYPGYYPIDLVSGMATNWTIGVSGTSVVPNLSLAPPTVTAFISSAYTGWRGSSVYHAKVSKEETILNGTTGTNNIYGIRVSRFSITRFMRGLSNIFSAGVLSGFQTWSAFPRSAFATIADANYKYWAKINSFARGLSYTTSGNSGMAVTNPEDVTVVDAVVPYYSQFRMFPGNPIASGMAMLSPNRLTWNAFDKTTDDVWIAAVAVNAHVSSDIDLANDPNIVVSVPSVDVYHKAGPDFTCFMYLNPATIYAYTENIDGYISGYH